MSSNRKNKKNNKKMNHHVLNSYTMEALEPRLMMAADLGAALEEFSNQADFSSVLNSSLDQNLSSYTNCVCLEPLKLFLIMKIKVLSQVSLVK